MKKNKKTIIFFPIIKGTAIRDIIKRKVLHILSDKIKSEGKAPLFVFLVLGHNLQFEPLLKGLDYQIKKIPNIDFDNNPKILFFRRLRNYLYASINKIGKYDIVMQKQKKLHPVLFQIHKIIQISCKIKLIKRFFWIFANTVERFEIFYFRNKDKEYAKIFDKYKPDLLFMHSYQDINLIPLERVAKRKKVMTISMVQSWDNITTNGEIPVKPDQLIVWSKLMAKEAAKYARYNPKKIFISGPLQFDYHKIYKRKISNREAFFKQMHLDENKSLVTYTTTSGLAFPKEIEFVVYLNNLINKKVTPPAQLLVRVYSKCSKEEADSYKKLKKEGINIDLASGKNKLLADLMPYDDDFLVHLSETMKNSDVIINLISTVNLDAFVFDTPMINIGFEGKIKKNYLESVRRYNDYTHATYVYRKGAARIAHNEKEMINIINTYLKDRSVDSKERKDALNFICGKIDTKSNQRIADFLFKQLKKI